MSAATTQVLKEGRYSVEQELTSRANRKFFQAYDVQEQEAVSIVAVDADAVAGRSVLPFHQLIGALARFRHKYAHGLRDSFVESKVQYLVTDLIDGPDMASVLEEQEYPFPVPQVTIWGESLLEVLQGLHTFRPATIFESLRPEALIMRPDGDLSLLLSEMFEGETGIRRPAAAVSANRSLAYAPLEKIWSGLDAASQKVIIKNYDDASERALKQESDARSDIYSVGATLYHLVTGQQPADALERSIEIIDGNPDPLELPHEIVPAIPREISDVIVKAMEIKREFRFDSAAIMRQVLRTAVVRARERGEDISVPGDKAAVTGKTANGTLPGPPKPTSTAPADAVLSKVGTTGHPGTLDVESADRSPAPKATEKVRTCPVSVTTDLDADDDLLGILTSTSPSSPEAANRAAQEAVVQPASPSSFQRVDPEPKPAPPGPAVRVPASEPELSMFAEPAQARSSRGLMIAAAAVVLVCFAVGGWFFLGGTSAAPTRPAAAEQTVVPQTQAALPEPQPQLSAEPAALSESEVPAADTPVVASDTDQPTRASAPAQRVRKPAAQAPKPVQKKAVTADDLINDN